MACDEKRPRELWEGNIIEAARQAKLLAKTEWLKTTTPRVRPSIGQEKVRYIILKKIKFLIGTYCFHTVIIAGRFFQFFFAETFLLT